MSKKDALRLAFDDDKKPSNRTDAPAQQAPEFMPIEPLSLSANKRVTEQPEQPAQPTKRAYNASRLAKPKRGIKQVKRYSFEITPELHKEMLQVLAKYTADTGNKISASEFIRKAIARELREFKR
jgi:hypothetical protein